MILSVAVGDTVRPDWPSALKPTDCGHSSPVVSASSRHHLGRDDDQPVLLWALKTLRASLREGPAVRQPCASRCRLTVIEFLRGISTNHDTQSVDAHKLSILVRPRIAKAAEATRVVYVGRGSLFGMIRTGLPLLRGVACGPT